MKRILWVSLVFILLSVSVTAAMWIGCQYLAKQYLWPFAGLIESAILLVLLDRMTLTIGWKNLRILGRSLPLLYLGLVTMIIVLWNVPKIDIASEGALYLMLPFALTTTSWFCLSAKTIARNSVKSSPPIR